MTESARVKAVGAISIGKVRALEAVSLAIIEAGKYERLRATLEELASAIEFDVVLAAPSRRLRRHLDEAWQLVDPDGIRRRAERLAAGCVQCGGRLESSDHDVCAGCAAKVPPIPLEPAAEYEHRPLRSAATTPSTKCCRP